MIDVELLPGDILYIPPGFPHDGVSLAPSMSFSVGFRAKSACDMLSGLADHVIDKDMGATLLSDPQRPVHQNQGQINAQDFALIKSNLQALLDDDQLMADFAGSYFSKNKCALDLQALDEQLAEPDLVNMLDQQALIRTGGLRCFYVDPTLDAGVCYVDGERYAFGKACKKAVLALCDNDTVSASMLRTGLKNAEFVRVLTGWVNAGYWYFQED
jgi:50S ribosomal protein L16 3-hydroxylase